MNKNTKENNTTIYKQLNDLNKLKKKKEDKNLIIKRGHFIIFIFFILLTIGFFNFYSAISHYNPVDINKKIVKFLIILTISLFAAIITYKSYKYLKKREFRTFIFLGGVILFLIVAFFPSSSIFPTINGGKGWIRISKFSLQITELFKIAYVVLLAGLLSRGKDREDSLSVNKSIGGVIIYFILFFILLYFLKDVGTGIHYALITVFLIFISDINNKVAYGLVTSGILATPLILFGMYKSSSNAYWFQRVRIYLDGLLKNSYDRFEAFQIYQSLVGIGTGGLFGKGYGNGIQKYNYIPEVETDFAIATFAEEFGFVGMFLLLFIFLIFFMLIMGISENSKTYFEKYLVAGIAGYFITQVIINIAVAVGLLPVFGIPLPFISSGGSSLLTLSIAIAIVLKINRENLKN